MKLKKTAPKEQTAVRFDSPTLKRLEIIKERTGLSMGYLIRKSVEATLPHFESGRFLKLIK